VHERFVLLACDGVFDVISYKEAATIAAEFAEIPVKAAEAVVARALELGSSDNCSCSLLLL
jgi:serine/threonine protein phosphatase PrpC